MPTSLDYGLALAGVYVLWRLLRRKSSLDILRGPPTSSWLKGNYPELLGAKCWEWYNEEAATKYGGAFKAHLHLKTPILYVHDPKALHHIMIKDIQNYDELDDFRRVTRLFFGPGLLSSVGEQHRKQRRLLNPLFNVAHLRDITGTLYNVAYKLRGALRRNLTGGPDSSTEVDMLPWATQAALECVGQGILGHSFESFTENSTVGPYTATLKNLVPVWNSFAFVRILLLPLVENIGTAAFQRWVISMIPWNYLHMFRDMSDLLHGTSTQIYETKKTAYEQKKKGFVEPKKATEILALIMEANELATEEDRLDRDEIVGQISTFTFAGMDTTSNALCRVLHLLSQHHDVQEKLRQEIINARNHVGDLHYDDLNALPYLDAIIRETLRYNPPLPNLFRITTDEVVLPLANPVTSTEGRPLHELLIPKGTIVMCSIQQSNRNPDIWGPDAHEWKPERWLSPLPDSVNEARIPGVFSNLMTFNGGGRACVGFKFAQLELKILVSVLIESFQFSHPDKKINWEFHGNVHPVVPDDEGDTNVNGPTFKLPLLISPIT